MAFAISTPSQYAIRALVHLARHCGGDTMRVRDIAEAEDIPYPFFAKEVRQLVRDRLLTVTRGPGGGVRLARAPRRISVLQVVKCIDGPGVLEECVLRQAKCNARNPCLVHEKWKGLRERLRDEFRETTIEDLANVKAGRRKRR